MGDETRLIHLDLRHAARRRPFLEVRRERGYWVVYNRVTRSTRYYKQARDVDLLLSRGEPAL